MSAQRSQSISSAGSATTELNTSSSAVTLPSTRRKRTQYRSCDQCRASKRACDLSANAQSACSTCTTRQIKCTTQWLGQKKHKRLHPLSDTTPASPPSPTVDFNIVSDALAEHVKLCKLRIYTNLIEFPFSHWLAPGCNPYFPSFDSGEADSPKGQLARCLLLTSGAHDQLKGASSNPSKLMQQLSLLDALLLRSQLQQRGVEIEDLGEARLRGIRERNKVIDEAFTWAAVAHAFQYTATADFVASGAQRAQARTRSRTLTTAAWQKARRTLFSNVSFVSFKNALAFLLFGITTPPTMHIAGESSPAEDTAFAVAHGLRLMQNLCQQAKSYVGPDSGHIAPRALKAAMWLNEICKAVLIPTLTALLKDEAITMLPFHSDTPGPADESTLVRNPSFVGRLMGRGESGASGVMAHGGVAAAYPSMEQVDLDPWTQVIDQAQASLMSSAILSFKLDACAHGDLIEIRHELNEAAAYKTLIWKMVADFETDSSSAIALDVATGIARQWQASHAIVVDSALAAYNRLEPESRTMLAFAVHHSSLGLFSLDSLVSKRGQQDAQKLREWQSVDPGNLLSAQRVALLCARARSDALGGLTVTADQAEMESGRDLSQSFPMGQWCHPFPPLVLQAQAWAAHYLLQHAEGQGKGTHDSRDWIQLVDHCLFCLDMMHDSLASFPSHALDRVPMKGLLERRAFFPP